MTDTSKLGPAYWEPPWAFRHEGLVLDGREIADGVVSPLSELQVPNARSGLLETAGGGTVFQARWVAGATPLNLERIGLGDFSLTLFDRADLAAFMLAAAKGSPVVLWPDWPLPDVWYLPGSGGVTTFSTARMKPWDLPGVSFATRAPAVLLDGVELEIITGGTPTSGQALVAETGGYGTVGIDAGDAAAGTFLALIYPPALEVLIRRVRLNYSENNRLECTLTMEEHLGGVYP